MLAAQVSSTASNITVHHLHGFKKFSKPGFQSVNIFYNHPDAHMINTDQRLGVYAQL